MSTTSYRKTWDRGVVEVYITQESQEKSPEIFLKTHLPITHIRAQILIGGEAGFISEQEFLDHIVQSSLDTGKNRIYLLKGEVGSGKSHLCQWLEYQLNGTGDNGPRYHEHVAIHISRNNTKLADILDKLYEHIDADHEEIEDITAYDDYPDMVDTLLSMLGTFDQDRTFNDPDFDFEKFISDNETGRSLRDVLVENLEDYRDGVEAEDKEQRFELLTREQFREICFIKFGHGFGGDRGDDIYPAVRNAISDRLMINIGITDFQQDLEEISKLYRAEEKRPVLICEDVTTFNVLKDDLLDHIFALGDGTGPDHGFDIVLGYTTGWETEKADDALTTGDLSFMKERAQGYLTLTDREGRAYFLQQGSMPVRLVERYLTVIKQHSGVDRSWNVDSDVFDGLYPFNRRFIVRAYRHLQEDGDTQRTPRLLLYHVIGDALLSDVPPFRRVADNTHIAEFAAPMSVQHLSPDFKQLVKWYGRMDGGDVVLDVDIPLTFGVDIPDDLEVKDGLVRLEAIYRSGGWEVTDDELEGFDPTEFGTESNTTVTDDGGEDSSGRSDISGPVVDVHDEEESDRARRIGQFQSWIGTGDEFPSSNRLTEGVQEALKRFYDPTRLANERSTTSAGFYYTRGPDVPVTIIGADERKSISVEVPFDTEFEQLYLDLFRYGLDDTFPPEANLDRIRGWCDQKVLDFREQLRDDLESCLPEEDLDTPFGLEELLVLAQVFIYNARTGQTDLGAEAMFIVPEHTESSPFRPDSDRFELPGGFEEGFDDINHRRSDVKDLCEGFFLLKENFVDFERLELALRHITEDLEGYIDAAIRISAADLQDAYRIGTSRSAASSSTQVNSFFTTVSDYANEVQKLPRELDLGPVHNEIDTVRDLHNRNHTKAELLSIFERLEESISHLDDPMEADWVKLGEKLANDRISLDLGEFGDTLDHFDKVDPDTGLKLVEFMHDYNRNRRIQAAWEVYEVFEEMMETVESHEDVQGTVFSEELSDTKAFDAFQRNRDQALKVLEGI